MTDPKPTRRRFQFSLRTLLVFVTLCAVLCSWLAIVAKMRQAKQEWVVASALEALGGHVLWSKPRWPAWLHGLLGDDVFCKVQGVSFDNTKITDTCLMHLKGLNQLQKVGLGETQVTDIGLETLGGLSQLEMLGLDHTKITDVGLEHLKGLSQLQVLELSSTQITDAGLESILGLNRLQYLGVGSTRVTDAGVKKLKQALPHCQINR